MEQPNEKELTQAYLKQVEILEEDDDFDEFEIDGIYFLIFFIFFQNGKIKLLLLMIQDYGKIIGKMKILMMILLYN